MPQNNPPSRIKLVLDECLPLLKALGKGRYAVSIGGSHGKGIFDGRSDIDFRLFCDEIVGGSEFWKTQEWKSFSQIIENSRAQGIEIDYCWIRTVSEIETQLEAWLSGKIQPVDLVWTVWGYHLLTDLANQMIIDDPDGLIAGWQARLTPYPRALQQAMIRKHMESLNYWRTDYHYRNKVDRGDVVFLAGLSARLVHDSMQVLFAINQTFYVGDGNNLRYVEKFAIRPKDFTERINAILYPAQTTNMLTTQYKTILDLIDELALLAAQAETDAQAGTSRS